MNARQRGKEWLYLVDWESYAEHESAHGSRCQTCSWEANSSELEQQAAALREAARAGTLLQPVPLEPGVLGWLTGLTTRGSKKWLIDTSGGALVRIGKVGEGGGAIDTAQVDSTAARRRVQGANCAGVA